MLLSEQDRTQLEDDLEQQIGKNAFDAIEAAILARLASAELPDLPAPSEMDGARWGYTSDDMQSHAIEAHAQGFAAGAASQLAEKPSGYLWAPKKKPELAKLAFQVEPSVQLKALGYVSEPLYTRREAK